MLFNSTDFLVFFACFCVAYALVHNSLRLRNWLVVVASYTFYSQWDYRFTGLLLFTSVLDYTVARRLELAQSPRRRRGWLVLSVVLNLGVLGLFKYFDFFRTSFEGLLLAFGADVHWKAWNIVLPVGISFYTFQSMSYVVDVYRGHMPASRDLVRFLAYVSFFPQLVAGPIERGTNLVPQFCRTVTITAADLELGLWLVIWGMFKKVVLADNLSPLVALAYEHATPSAPMVILGTVAFGLQIYCDFSGYCDIGSGVAKMLGFKLMLNFNLPYFATTLRDFWRRWHISLSTWLRDYLYVPLGGNRGGEFRTYLNLGLTMLVGGLWHGAAVPFVLWGVWHGAGLAVNRAWEEHRSAAFILPAWAGWFLTQLFVLFGWLLFRAGTTDSLVRILYAFGCWTVPDWWPRYLLSLCVLTAPLLAMQWWQWRKADLNVTLGLPRWARGVLQALLVVVTWAFWQRDEPSPFIYFQF